MIEVSRIHKRKEGQENLTHTGHWRQEKQRETYNLWVCMFGRAGTKKGWKKKESKFTLSNKNWSLERYKIAHVLKRHGPEKKNKVQITDFFKLCHFNLEKEYSGVSYILAPETFFFFAYQIWNYPLFCRLIFWSDFFLCNWNIIQFMWPVGICKMKIYN